MHILQNTMGIVRHRQTEVALEAGVPRIAQVRRVQATGDEVAFQFEAQQDVEVVVHLVGFGADVAGLDAVDGTVEIVRPAQATGAEMAFDLRP